MRIGSVQLATAAWILIMLPVASAASSEKPDPTKNSPTSKQADPANPVVAGSKNYRSYCARCHGLNMVASSSAYYDLRRFPKDNKARFVSSVMNGKRAMPAWKGRLSDTQIEALWQYVLSGG